MAKSETTKSERFTFTITIDADFVKGRKLDRDELGDYITEALDAVDLDNLYIEEEETGKESEYSLGVWSIHREDV